MNPYDPPSESKSSPLHPRPNHLGKIVVAVFVAIIFLAVVLPWVALIIGTLGY